MNRRDFLREGLAGAAFARLRGERHGRGPGVVLVADPGDPVVGGPPAQGALAELGRRLADAGTAVRTVCRVEDAGTADL